MSKKTATEKRLIEWTEVEELIIKYKKQFDSNATPEVIEEAKRASEEVLEKFSPLFKKYILLIKTSKIDFDDSEMKRFVLSFIGDRELKTALKRKKQTAKYRHLILQKFNFVKETYGAQTEMEILIDLQMLFLILAKRYKQMGRNFCAYLYNSYSYEVSRHIKKYIKNPANISYKNVTYEEYMMASLDEGIEEGFEDKIYEDNMGIPDFTWTNGQSCSDEFLKLTVFERKLLLKYYMEDYNDRQIAEEFGMHINTVNQKRRKAIAKVAEALHVDVETIKRSRRSGKKALFYTK